MPIWRGVQLVAVSLPVMDPHTTTAGPGATWRKRWRTPAYNRTMDMFQMLARFGATLAVAVVLTAAGCSDTAGELGFATNGEYGYVATVWANVVDDVDGDPDSRPGLHPLGSIFPDTQNSRFVGTGRALDGPRRASTRFRCAGPTDPLLSSPSTTCTGSSGGPRTL